MILSLILTLGLLGPYSSMDAAANAALTNAVTCSHNVIECGGTIFEQHSTYWFTEPLLGKPFGVDLGPAYDAVPNSRPVADYHIHICNSRNVIYSPFFSHADTEVNKGLHTIGYMLSFCDGNIRRFDPIQDDVDDEEVDFESGKVIYLTIGHITGVVMEVWEELHINNAVY
jgi:hypothetical protein